MDARSRSDRQQETDYPVLQGLMVNLVQSRAGRPIMDGEAWLNDAQTLARKMYEHLASLRVLTNVHRVEFGGHHAFEFIDHSSVKVVARAALETYLVFFFIFGGSDRSLCQFRHKIWKFGGLTDRQKIVVTTTELRDKQAVEKVAMDYLKLEIKASPHFAAYGPDGRKRVLKGEWRVGASLDAIGRSAGFHESYFRNTYSYLCGYSHASYISAMQVGEARSLDDQRMLASSCIGIGSVLMSHFANAYTKLFGDALPLLEGDPAAKAAVNRWAFSAEDWAQAIAKRLAS